jgi:hypothetical protein
VDAYLQGLIQENEELVSILSSLEARAPALSREQVREKLERGIAQLERGEVVDIRVMSGLLAALMTSNANIAANQPIVASFRPLASVPGKAISARI